MRRIIPILALLILLAAAKDTATTAPRPLIHAHAHNDYEHTRPLADALEQGFCSVEADVHLIQGHLLVAHDPRALRPERTLQALYLDPLKKRVVENGGRVYRDGPTVTLMIDVKSDAAQSYAALKETLKPYESMLTVFRGDQVEPGAITIVISGNRDRATMAGEAVRFAALDGFMGDLDAAPPPPASLVTWVSGQWKKSFTWKGEGPIGEADAAKLKALVAKAHAQNRLIRFWDIPDCQPVWQTLTEAGVDLINTDDLPGLAKFLNETK
jgi:glycerophosphoryl diester phosphodiesterase